MKAIESDDLKDLQVQKELLDTQKELLELKTQIANLTKAMEDASAADDGPTVESANGDEQETSASEEEPAEETEPEEKPVGATSYLTEITAYDVLKATAEKIGGDLASISGIGDSDKILVLCNPCQTPQCLPFSDVVYHQTIQQIELISDQVEYQTTLLENLLPMKLRKLRLEEIDKGKDKDANSDDRETDDGEEKPLYDIVSTLLGGWTEPVKVANELVKSVGTLLGQFASTFAVQERDMTLPLEALIDGSVGLIGPGQVHLLSMGQITDHQDKEDVILAKLRRLIQAIYKMEAARIALTTAVVAPLNAKSLKLNGVIKKLQTNKEAIEKEISVSNKRIGELKVKKQHETDPTKKTGFQNEIDLENADLQLLQGQLSTVNQSLVEEEQKLNEVDIHLNKTNSQVEVAANLAKSFNTYFASITTSPDKTTLSTLALAMLREYIRGFNYLLRLNIHSGGAETITRKFLGLESIRLIGGCAVSYTLTTIDGKVIKSGLEVMAGQRKFNFGNPAKMGLVNIPNFKK